MRSALVAGLCIGLALWINWPMRWRRPAWGRLRRMTRDPPHAQQGGGALRETGRRPSARSSPGAWAARAHRGAAMARAGLGEDRIWRELFGDQPETSWPAALLVRRVVEGIGCPVAGTLDRLAAVTERQTEQSQEREAALGAARATARVLGVLPLAGLGLGSLVGVNPLAVLVGTSWGRLLLCIGAAFWLAGVVWIRRLVAGAGRVATGLEYQGTGSAEQIALSLVFELIAEVVAAGTGPLRAANVVATAWALIEPGPMAQSLAEVVGTGARPAQGPLAELVAAFDMAVVAGVGPSALIRAAADDLSRSARWAGQGAAQRLAVLSVLPMGLCFLPAFIVLTVAPLVIGLLSTTNW